MLARFLPQKTRAAVGSRRSAALAASVARALPRSHRGSCVLYAETLETEDEEDEEEEERDNVSYAKLNSFTSKRENNGRGGRQQQQQRAGGGHVY